MKIRNHPLGDPAAFAARLAQRHTDIGFILAQLNREYGRDCHGLTRDQVAKMRKPEPEPYHAKMTRHMTDDYIRACDFREFKNTLTGDAKLVESLLRAKCVDIAPILKKPKPRLSKYTALMPEEVPVGPRKIMASIAHEMGVTVADILGIARAKRITQARLVTYKVFRVRGAYMKSIAEWMGRSDHRRIGKAIYRFDRDATPEMRELVRRWTPEEKING